MVAYLARRRYHTHLNRLILSRLPLALPPVSKDPELYATGLLHFAPVYLTFESIWERLIASESDNELPIETAVVLSALIHLFIPELSRTERLLKDLSVLLRTPQDEVAMRLYTPEGERLLSFLAHIETAAEEKPHVLIAYAWVMYMALFNGGYWIRSQLQTARDTSWDLSQISLLDMDSKAMSEKPDSGLAFWSFPGQKDGQEFKEEFKERLSDVENMLSTGQRDDIVQEARIIFQHCGLLVKELDEIVASKKKAESAKNKRALTSWLHYLLPLGLLLGVFIRWVFRLLTAA